MDKDFRMEGIWWKILRWKIWKRNLDSYGKIASRLLELFNRVYTIESIEENLKIIF
jgi:hypothetical protein